LTPEPFFAVAPSASEGSHPQCLSDGIRGVSFILCCNLYFSAYNYLKKRAKDIEIIEIKLEKELQEIKALLLQSLKHYEHSESKTSYSSYSLFLFFLYTVLMFIKGLFF